MLAEYLAKLGLTAKEQALYTSLLSLGVQPASVVARRCGFDRVSTYKHLKKLTSQGLINIHVRDGVQCFGISGSDGISSYLREQAASYEQLLTEVPIIDKVLRAATRGEDLPPVVQVFEGKSGIKNLFRDVLFEARQEGVLRIRILTSNTFDQQMGNVTLAKFADEFFRDAKQRKLGIEIVEASGTLLPEHVRRIDPEHFSPSDFPAARGATSVLLVGTALYLACYSSSPIGLKIKQQQMSQIFHFFLDAISRTQLGTKD